MKVKVFEIVKSGLSPLSEEMETIIQDWLNKNDQISTNKNIIYWKLIPGSNNNIEFSYWYWNKFILGTLIVILLVFIAYFIRRNRFEIGSNLPELPS